MNRVPHTAFLLLLIVFFIHTTPFYAQSPASVEECQNLIDRGRAEITNEDYPKALEYLTQAEIMAESKSFHDKIFVIKNNLGIIYTAFSNYGEALGYYQQALEVADKNGVDGNMSKVLNNIGLIYKYEGDYKQALEYFNRSYMMAKEKNTDHAIISVNISDCHNERGNFKEAFRYLKEVEKKPMNKSTALMWKINYAESLFLSGQSKQAQAILDDLDNDIDNNCFVCVAELMSKIYVRANKIPIAIAYAKKGLAQTDKMKDRLELYQRLSQLYLLEKEYNMAFKYKDSAFLAKDSLSLLSNRGLVESNKLKLKIKDYQNETEKYAAQRRLLIIVIIFCVLLFLFIYRGLKNKIVKQKHERQIAENNQKIIDLELESLKNNIAEKNRKLSAKALYLSGRNELIEDVINSLGQISEISGNSNVSNYLKTLKGYLKTDAEWDDFITYFEQVNPDFLRTLTTRYPELTPSDIRYICYVFMNLDTREIGNIFNITYNAAKKRKTRIQEKLGVDAESSLYDFLLKIVHS